MPTAPQVPLFLPEAEGPVQMVLPVEPSSATSVYWMSVSTSGMPSPLRSPTADSTLVVLTVARTQLVLPSAPLMEYRFAEVSSTMMSGMSSSSTSPSPSSSLS